MISPPQPFYGTFKNNQQNQGRGAGKLPSAATRQVLGRGIIVSQCNGEVFYEYECGHALCSKKYPVASGPPVDRKCDQCGATFKGELMRDIVVRLAVYTLYYGAHEKPCRTSGRHSNYNASFAQ